MNNNDNGYMYKSGNIEEITSNIFNNILKLSNLGLKKDSDFIKRLSLALKMLSEMDEYAPIEPSEFMHPFIAYDDFNTGKAYEVYFDGVNDSFVIKEINSPNIGNGKIGFAIGCVVDPVGENNTCVVAWPDSKLSIPNSDFLGLLSTYGFMMSGVLPKSDVISSKKSDVAASLLFDIINTNAHFIESIGNIPSTVKKGLENIINLNFGSAGEYNKASELLLGFIDVINGLMYYIMYNKVDGVVTLAAKDTMLNGDTSSGDIIITYRTHDGGTDAIGVNTNKVSESGEFIPFIDVIKSMVDMLIII